MAAELQAMRIPPEAFTFLEELKANNNREWFQANKQRFETELREPLLGFIESFAPRLEEISPYFLAIASKSGGSLFRIFRDVRFSKDKSPYKTNAGIHFRHENGKDAHAPGFYLHLSPEECFCAAGMWRPDSPSLKAVRQAIIDKPERWKKVSRDSNFELSGESLKRPPRGFDSEHPLLEDLKRKDHVAVIPLTRKTITRKDFLDTYDKHCRNFADYVKFLAQAVGQPF